MIGVGDALGSAIMLALVLLVLTPFVTLVFLNEVGVFNGLKGARKQIIVILTVVGSIAITLGGIRIQDPRVLSALLVYDLIILLAWVLLAVWKRLFLRR